MHECETAQTAENGTGEGENDIIIAVSDPQRKCSPRNFMC